MAFSFPASAQPSRAGPSSALPGDPEFFLSADNALCESEPDLYNHGLVLAGMVGTARDWTKDADDNVHALLGPTLQLFFQKHGFDVTR